MSALAFRPAVELAELIRSNEVSATEVLGDCLAAIDALQPEINAFTHLAGESALEAAEAVTAGDQRPFAGVPIAIKDNRAVAGMPITEGSDLFGDVIARRDSFLVRRLREAGFVIVGKTSLPEMGILPTTEPRRFGPVRNPWSLDRTPGGSSGGSAAAVAAGMLPVAHGNDGGGSIRIPAACCGLVGLKPARGRVSVGPEGGHSFLVSDGVLTRTVGDTAAVLDVLAGYELGDSTWAVPPDGSYGETYAQDPGRRRIGVALNAPLDDAVLDPACEAAVRDAATLLESIGHEVSEITPPWSGRGLPSDFTRIYGPLISMTTFIGGRIAKREPTEADVEPLTWLMWQRAHEQTALDMLGAQGRVETVARSIVSYLAPFDAVLTPVLAERQLPIGVVNGLGPDAWARYQRASRFTPYTSVVNITGLPAISLPLYQGDDGLPTAVQLIGPPAGEDVLLRLAAQLERALPWADRRPPPAPSASD